MLTGRAVTDPVTAGSTGLYHKREGGWIDELLEHCNLTRTMVPEVLYPAEVAGTLTADAAKALGLSQDVLVAVGTNDQTVGAVGAGNVVPGFASLTLGTALAIIVTSDPGGEPPEGVVSAIHAARGLDTYLAFAKTSGVVIRWFRDTFSQAVSYEELFSEVDKIPIGADGLTCLPHFSGTGTPDFIASARGGIYGLTLAHTKAHMFRAIVESLVFTVCQGISLIGKTTPVKEFRAIGGGAKSDVWLQMIADATGVPVERPKEREAACLGAAELAMVAAGEYSSVVEASLAIYQPEKRFEPNPRLKHEYDEAFARYCALYRTLYVPEEA
jgi:xylulokinase